MAVHTFDVKVSNPEARTAAAELRVEVITDADLASLGYALPPERLRLRSIRLATRSRASTLLGCRDAIRAAIRILVGRILGRLVVPEPLVVTLEPVSETYVRVTVDAGGAKGAAGVRLVDRRNGRIVGGATLLVFRDVEDTRFEPTRPPNPCPIELVTAPYWLPIGIDPREPSPEPNLPVGVEVDLVAWVTNPSSSAVAGAVAYLEHLGGGPVEFELATFHLGRFEPGSRYPLRWRLRTIAGLPGSWETSIVVSGDDLDPVRLRSTYSIGRSAGPEPVPTGPAALGPA